MSMLNGIVRPVLVTETSLDDGGIMFPITIFGGRTHYQRFLELYDPGSKERLTRSSDSITLIKRKKKTRNVQTKNRPQHRNPPP